MLRRLFLVCLIAAAAVPLAAQAPGAALSAFASRNSRLLPPPSANLGQRPLST